MAEFWFWAWAFTYIGAGAALGYRDRSEIEDVWGKLLFLAICVLLWPLVFQITED